MAANVEHDFKRGFIIGEEQLRKLHEIVNNRVLKSGGKSIPAYQVTRGDSYTYTTENIQDVINEDNEDWREIKKLEINVLEKDIFYFRLNFSKLGVTLSITGNDRDAVFLLFSDLREYITNEILTNRLPDRSILRLIPFILFTIFTLATLYDLVSSIEQIYPLNIQKVLASSNEIEKLNFLIQQHQKGNPQQLVNFKWLIVFMLLMLLSVTNFFEWTWNALFPSNVFLFGKRKTSFEKKAKLISNIIWVVVIGSIVSVIAGLLVWRMTSTN